MPPKFLSAPLEMGFVHDILKVTGTEPLVEKTMKKKQSLIMQDSAHLDPRSVLAMLQGRGDGREKLYWHFERLCTKIHPWMPLEWVHRFYSDFCGDLDRNRVAKWFAFTKPGRFLMSAWYVIAHIDVRTAAEPGDAVLSAGNFHQAPHQIA